MIFQEFKKEDIDKVIKEDPIYLNINSINTDGLINLKNLVYRQLKPKLNTKYIELKKEVENTLF